MTICQIPAKLGFLTCRVPEVGTTPDLDLQLHCPALHPPTGPHPTTSPVYSQLDPHKRPSSFTGKPYRTKPRASLRSLTWNLGTAGQTAHTLSVAYCPLNSWNSPRTAVWNLFYSPYTNTFSFPPLDKWSCLLLGNASGYRYISI